MDYSSNKIKTLFPNKTNIANDEQVPIPIESIFYLEESTRDLSKPNRFYFNYPAQWITSNKGESIIGVRNIYINARRRKLEFELSIRKYFRKDFDELKAKDENKNKSNDEIYNMISEYRKSEITYNVKSWLGTEHDLRNLFYDISTQMESAFKIFNSHYEKIDKAKYDIMNEQLDELSKQQSNLIYQMENEKDISKIIELRKQIEDLAKQQELKNEEWKSLFRPSFRQEKDNLKRRDLQMDGYYDYDKNTFIETIFSPCNEMKNNDETYDNILDNDRFDYYVDFKLKFIRRPLDKNGKQDNSINQIYDFVDVMNIGKESFQNDPQSYYDKWMREINFYNVWDRHSCKVYSSFACDSSKGYLGNSQIFYHTIKYFKLNSTDQQFWIEFYSGRHNKIPVILPINESFNMELQFLQYQKLLYI